MAKLTRFTNFKTLKPEDKLRKATVTRDKKLNLEWKAYLNQLKSEYAKKKKTNPNE